MINGYMSIKEAAEKWSISSRRVQMFCVEGRIDGAAKLGREWAIPSNAKKPQNHRLRSGRYVGWRKNTKE